MYVNDVHVRLYNKQSLHFEKGIFDVGLHVVTGKNGAGKSTLMKAIAGTCACRMTGSISIPTSHMLYFACDDDYDCRSQFRVKTLFHLFSRNDERDTALSDILHKHVGELSTGQRRRMELACAISSDNSVIILDETTANLDAETTQSTIKDLITMAQRLKKIVFIVDHGADLSAVHFVSEVRVSGNRVTQHMRCVNDCGMTCIPREPSTNKSFWKAMKNVIIIKALSEYREIFVLMVTSFVFPLIMAACISPNSTSDIQGWYAERTNAMVINIGVVLHAPIANPVRYMSKRRVSQEATVYHLYPLSLYIAFEVFFDVCVLIIAMFMSTLTLAHKYQWQAALQNIFAPSVIIVTTYCLCNVPALRIFPRQVISTLNQMAICILVTTSGGLQGFNALPSVLQNVAIYHPLTAFMRLFEQTALQFSDGVSDKISMKQAWMTLCAWTMYAAAFATLVVCYQSRRRLETKAANLVLSKKPRDVEMNSVGDPTIDIMHSNDPIVYEGTPMVNANDNQDHTLSSSHNPNLQSKKSISAKKIVMFGIFFLLPALSVMSDIITGTLFKTDKWEQILWIIAISVGMFCFWICVVIYRIIIQRDLQCLRSSTTIEVSGWAAGHMLHYALVAYLAPQYVMICLLLGTAFEYVEELVAACGVQFVDARPFEDTIVNGLGAAIGSFVLKWSMQNDFNGKGESTFANSTSC
jgi:energy-coupling factor transporter ATP-binding protein EcfA2